MEQGGRFKWIYISALLGPRQFIEQLVLLAQCTDEGNEKPLLLGYPRICYLRVKVKKLPQAMDEAEIISILLRNNE